MVSLHAAPGAVALPGSSVPRLASQPGQFHKVNGGPYRRAHRVTSRQSGQANVVAPYHSPQYEEGQPHAGAESSEAAAAVGRVLQLIADTDSGDKASGAQREEIDSLLNQLEALGQQQRPRTLDNPLIWGNYNVAYVSTGKTQQGQPAGGRFRTGIGKLLFSTTVLAQSVLQPDVVTNKVGFALLGLLHGSVGLRGKLVGIPEKEGQEDSKDTVKVFFEPPVLSLLGNVHMRIGPPSSVVLKTTYLDDRVRLGRGSRGSLFVFTRGGEADRAGMDQVGLQRSTPAGLLLLSAVLALMICGGSYAASRPILPVPARALGAVGALLGAGLVAVFWRGGQFEDNTDRPEVQPQ